MPTIFKTSLSTVAGGHHCSGAMRCPVTILRNICGQFQSVLMIQTFTMEQGLAFIDQDHLGPSMDMAGGYPVIVPVSFRFSAGVSPLAQSIDARQQT